MATTEAGSDRAGGEPGNLVLWLAVGKQIVINAGRTDEIVLTCVSSGDKGAKIAFEAPRSVPIDRREVHDDKVRRGLKRG